MKADLLALKKFAVFTLGLEQIFSSVTKLEERWRTEKHREVPAGNNFLGKSCCSSDVQMEEDDKTYWFFAGNEDIWPVICSGMRRNWR